MTYGEPWAISGKDLEVFIARADGIPALQAGIDECDSQYLDVDEKDLRRIVACVNFCKGLDTGWMEKIDWSASELIWCEQVNCEGELDGMTAKPEEAR